MGSSGYYYVFHNPGFNITGLQASYIYKNGANIAQNTRADGAGGGFAPGVPVQTLCFLNAGDRITFGVYSNSGSTNSISTVRANAAGLFKVGK